MAPFFVNSLPEFQAGVVLPLAGKAGRYLPPQAGKLKTIGGSSVFQEPMWLNLNGFGQKSILHFHGTLQHDMNNDTPRLNGSSDKPAF